MKTKKLKLFVAFFVIMVTLLFIPKYAKASTPTELYLGINEFRKNTTPADMAYGINNPLKNGDEHNIVGAKIWKLVQYDDASSVEIVPGKTFYCVRAGVGFSDTKLKETYDVKFNLKNEQDLVLLNSRNKDYIKSLVNKETGAYYNILALADLLYIPGVSPESYKQNIKQVVNPIGEFEEDLTDDDIDAVQQAAIWYFTNSDQEVFNQLDDGDAQNPVKDWLYYRLNNDQANAYSDYKAFTDLDNEPSSIVGSDAYSNKPAEQRNEQAKKWYKYLIDTAKANASKYKDGSIVSNTEISLYLKSNPSNSADPKENEQPVIEITKQKTFDLALRKSIIKVGEKTLSGDELRIPEIDPSTIATTETATYKHRKDPVPVQTGDEVTYQIRIYNEGEKPGRATIIKDQLPTGLKYKAINTEGFTAQSDSNNVVTITRTDKTDTTKDLAAYTSGQPASEVIEIVCEVTNEATAGIVLTNIAWIAEEIDTEAGITITTQEGADRDSEPSNAPNKTQQELPSYKGSATDTDLSVKKYYPGEQDDDDFEKLIIEVGDFDLRLIKSVAEVNDKEYERLKGVDVSKLNTVVDGKKVTTADYDMDKSTVPIKTGDIVKYRIRVYNEGEEDGYAAEISENIPEGLEFITSSIINEDEINSSEVLTAKEKEAILYNRLVWDQQEKSTTGKINVVKSTYLAKGKGLELEQANPTANLIKAFNSEKGYLDTPTEKNPDYRDIYVYMRVISTDVNTAPIKNIASISNDTDANGGDVTDRDSQPESKPEEEPDREYEDDEDYDNVILQGFDLALRKFVYAVNDTEVFAESDTLVPSRAPKYDTTKLDTIGDDGNLITTAEYNHTKEPLVIDPDSYIIYTIRVYNEGDIAGYASEITDYLPEGLEFVDGEFNQDYEWVYDEATRTIKSTFLNNTLIEGKKARTETDTEGVGPYVLNYKDIQIMCKLSSSVKTNQIQTNIAEISESKNDENIPDRDSTEDNVNPQEEDDPTNKEDDDNFEKVVIRPFDLALRKFITQVENEKVDTRIPQVKYDPNTEKKFTYEHSKDPVDVVTGNTVVYTIRVFNEGARDGYAAEVKDDIPSGLKFLPDNEINQEYRWVMYDESGKETTNVDDAAYIKTDYLSLEQGEERKEDEEDENPNLLKAFNEDEEISETNPDNRDVEVAFEVVEPGSSDNVIVNNAKISKETDKNGDEVEDDDSTPDEWNDGDDDQDKEYVKINYFDLALKKQVTQAIVIENGKQTVTQTGYTADQDTEPIVKVDLNRKNLNSVTVKFRYSIRVTNQGDIAGYAKEITDYIPQGLKFVPEDNPGWTQAGENVVTTTLLADTLLEPGQSADVEILLTWINGSDNFGLKTNTAEISKDYNDKGAPDRDSTPGNKTPGEDDIDDAPIMLSIKTGIFGQPKIYVILGTIILSSMAGGIFLIKRYVM